MYIKLPFRFLWIRYTKSVKIIFNLGALEDICKAAQIEFHELQEFVVNNSINFTKLLLYYGYIAGCKEDKVKPRYNLKHVLVWINYIRPSEQSKLFKLMEDMFYNIETISNPPDSKKKV